MKEARNVKETLTTLGALRDAREKRPAHLGRDDMFSFLEARRAAGRSKDRPAHKKENANGGVKPPRHESSGIGRGGRDEITG